MEFFYTINIILNKYEEFQNFSFKTVIINNIKGVVYLFTSIFVWTRLFLTFSQSFRVEYTKEVLFIILNAIILTLFGYGVMLILSGLNKVVYYFEEGIYNVFSFILPLISFITIGLLVFKSIILYSFIVAPIIYFIYTTIKRYRHINKLNTFFLY